MLSAWWVWKSPWTSAGKAVEVAVREGLGRAPVSRSPRLALLAELTVPKEIGLVSEGSPIPVQDADLRLSLLLTRSPLGLKVSMARVVSYGSGICSCVK